MPLRGEERHPRLRMALGSSGCRRVSSREGRQPGRRLRSSRAPGFQLIIPVVDVLRRVSLRVVTMPIQSQGIITRDNVSVDVSAVAYYKVADAVKSVVAIENVRDAIGQIAQITLRKVVGQHTLDETDQINLDIRKILEVTTAE